MRLEEVPVNGLPAFVAQLARQHGISYVRTGNDALAEVITRLADDEVLTDVTEDTLVALKRARVIDGPTMSALLNRHLTEKFLRGV